jgi:periplasmic divalent cation tolerance protein
VTPFAVVTTTVASKDDARLLARRLVEDRLAACVQLTPVESIYRWQGVVEEASEWMLICKIRRDDFPNVERMIRTLHSYDVPEIIMTVIDEGSAAYLAWLHDATDKV